MNPLIQQILDLVESIKSKLDDLFGIVNGFLDWVPWGLGWLADKIQDAWDYLVGKFNEFWAACELIFGNLGSPESIGSVSTSWSLSIGAPVSSQVGNADAGLLESDEHWTGTAADAYRPKTILQKTALTAVEANYSAGAISALDTVRNGLTKFYMGLITALGVLVAGIIGALGSAATIFGIPAGIFIAAGAALIAEGAFYTGGTLLKSDCTTANTNLLAKYANNAAFPSGAWPKGAVL